MKLDRRRSIFALSVLSATVLGSGCTIHTVRTSGTVHATSSARASANVQVTTPTYVTVTDVPPPLKQPLQARPARSGQATVWVDGHWSWSGSWVWVDGRWESPPRADYVWEPPVVVAIASGGYQFHCGYWRRQDQQPPTVYRTDGTIRVHVRAADEPPRANRVVVRAGEPAPRTVVVTGASREGSSSTVTVRTRPANGAATVRTRPANGAATVRTRPADRGRTTESRDASGQGSVRAGAEARGRATVRVRTNEPGRATTVRRPRQSNTPHGDTPRGDTARANTTVTPAATPRGDTARANTTVTPAATPRGDTARANTTVTPAATPRGDTARANTTVTPAATPRGDTARANTTVTPAATPRGDTARANTTVRTGMRGNGRSNGRSNGRGNGRQRGEQGDRGEMGNAATQAGGRSCRLHVAALPRNGVVVIRGSGLSGATGVMIGSQRVPMLDKRDDRVRARARGRNHGGNVRVLFGDEREECGTLRIVGR